MHVNIERMQCIDRFDTVVLAVGHSPVDKTDEGKPVFAEPLF